MVSLLIASLSACGSDVDSSERPLDGAGTATTVTDPPDDDGASGSDVLPCSETLRRLLSTDLPEPAPSIADYCDHHGSRVVLAVFPSSSDLEEQLSNPVGREDIWCVVGDRWTACAAEDPAGPGWNCNERDEAAAFASELHGELRSFGC